MLRKPKLAPKSGADLSQIVRLDSLCQAPFVPFRLRLLTGVWTCVHIRQTGAMLGVAAPLPTWLDATPGSTLSRVAASLLKVADAPMARANLEELRAKWNELYENGGALADELFEIESYPFDPSLLLGIVEALGMPDAGVEIGLVPWTTSTGKEIRLLALRGTVAKAQWRAVLTPLKAEVVS